MTNPRVTSSSCSGGDCVHLEQLDHGRIGVFATEDAAPTDGLTFTQAEMAAFFAGVRAGDFDHLVDEQAPTPHDPGRLAPGVLAEDLRALAECVPFEPVTLDLLGQAADWLDPEAARR